MAKKKGIQGPFNTTDLWNLFLLNTLARKVILTYFESLEEIKTGSNLFIVVHITQDDPYEDKNLSSTLKNYFEYAEYFSKIRSYEYL